MEKQQPVAHLSSASKLPRSIYIIGLVSLLNDVATDMVIPIVPIFLATTLGAGPWVLGLVEGIADAVAALLRLWAGRRSDASGGKRKPLALAGYTISNFARPLLGLASSWWHVVVLRAIDRVGKGIRSAPRDALIVDIAPARLRGVAFGIHRAFDNAGAVLGALIGAAIIYAFSVNLSQIVLVSAIPGFIAIGLLALGVSEPNAHKHSSETVKIVLIPLAWRHVSPPMQRYLLVLMLFTFARMAEVFIILRAHELGASVVSALLLWAAMNVVKVVSNYWGGALSDRIGKLRVMVPGWLLHCLAMFGFCFVSDMTSLWAATLFFGFAMAMTEGVERAVLGDYAHIEERGTLYGWYYALIGFASIPAGLAFGGVWQVFGASAAFAVCMVIGLISLALLHFWAAPALVAHK
jgi:MFS family permease